MCIGSAVLFRLDLGLLITLFFPSLLKLDPFTLFLLLQPSACEIALHELLFVTDTLLGLSIEVPAFPIYAMRHISLREHGHAFAPDAFRNEHTAWSTRRV
jgi:hypothetical protein